MTDPNATWPRPADEPRSQPFQPVSYDFDPEYTPPQTFQPPPQQQPPAYAPQPPPVYAPPPPPPPVYSPQAYPQPAFHGVPPQAAPPKRSRRGLKITLWTIGAVVVLCSIGTCVAGVPIIEEYGRTVTAPDQLPGGLTKSTDADMQSIVDDLKTELDSSLSTDTSVAGYYNTATNGHAVLLAGASTIVLSPGSDIDDAFKGLNSSLPVTDVQSYPPGKLGGAVKCGASSSSGVKLALCVWADHGTVGIGALFARDPADAAPLFVQIREAAESG